MGQACLAHSGGDGFDGSEHGVDELGQLAGRPLSLASGLNDKPGQGPYVRVKRRLIRHAGFLLLFPPRVAAAEQISVFAGAEDQQQVSVLAASQVLFIPRAMKPGGDLFVSAAEWKSECVYVCIWRWARGCRVSAVETGTL